MRGKSYVEKEQKQAACAGSESRKVRCLQPKGQGENREEQQARAAAVEQSQPAVPVIQEPAQPQVPEDLPPEPEPAPKPQRIPLEKSIQNQCAAYKTQGYEPTHSICSILAYMIGVDGDYFVEEPHSRLKKGVFDRADQRKDLQLVRQLCVLRNLVMRNCQEFSREIYRERRILSRLPAGMLDTLYLRFGKDLSPRDRTRTLGDYLIQINQEIRQAVDAVQNTTLRLFLPECVDPALIAKLIPFPDAIREQRARGTCASCISTIGDAIHGNVYEH